VRKETALDQYAVNDRRLLARVVEAEVLVLILGLLVELEDSFHDPLDLVPLRARGPLPFVERAAADTRLVVEGAVEVAANRRQQLAPGANRDGAGRLPRPQHGRARAQALVAKGFLELGAQVYA